MDAGAQPAGTQSVRQLVSQVEGAGHELGVWEGLVKAADLARRTAGSLYARGYDVDARITRDFASVLEDEAKRQREVYEIEYSAERTDALARIEALVASAKQVVTQ